MFKTVRKILSSNMLLCGLFLTSMSFTAKADFKSEIIESCLAYQSGTDKHAVNACKLYIDGFIDAAVFTESAAIIDVEQNNTVNKKPSNYMQRVYQTRLSSRLLNQQDDTNYQFCLSSESDRQTIASSIAKAIDIKEIEHKPLKQIVFETLEKQFPCK